MNTPTLIRGDDGGLHVRRFASQQDASNACAAHETSLFPTMTPDVMCRLIRVARRRRIERKGAWLTALHHFLAGSGAGAGRTEKRAAEAGEVTNFVRQQKRPRIRRALNSEPEPARSNMHCQNPVNHGGRHV